MSGGRSIVVIVSVCLSVCVATTKRLICHFSLTRAILSGLEVSLFTKRRYTNVLS